jgi:hypothetical protein
VPLLFAGGVMDRAVYLIFFYEYHTGSTVHIKYIRKDITGKTNLTSFVCDI